MHDIGKIVESVVKEVENRERYGIPDTAKKPERMTLETAREIIRAVEEKAAEMGVRAVTAVTDGGGNLVAAERMEDAFIASIDIAVNKAFTVVSLKMPTAKLAELASPGGSLYGIQFTNGGRIVIFGGGEPLTVDGRVIGGLGVSGGMAEQDTALGEYGRRYFETHFAGKQ